MALISLQTLYEGSLALPYKDPVRTGPDTPLPRTRRRAVVLFVCPQLDRFASHTTPGMAHYHQKFVSKYLRNAKKLDVSRQAF